MYITAQTEADCSVKIESNIGSPFWPNSQGERLKSFKVLC